MPKLRLKDYEKAEPLSDAAYARDLKTLHTRLREIQAIYLSHNERAVILFEGWDASGKGGCIQRIVEPLDQRFVEVFPIAAPEGPEKSQHYLQRFWRRLPRGGEVSIFDRSWYGRVLVERVEGFCSKADWKRAYDEINDFERALTDDGIRVIKLFLHISQAEQDKRLLERLANPWKRWKTGLDDYRNRARREDYLDALEDMFEKTSTKAAPWHIVDAGDKNAARIAGLSIVTKRLARGVKLDEPALDESLRSAAEAALGKDKVAAALAEHQAKRR